MKNIVLTRIDDRLIHGQVVTAWVKHTKGNRIIVIDNVLVKDAFMQDVLMMAAPSGIKVEVLSEEDAAQVLKEEAKKDERIIILVKIPQVIERLVNNGVEINTLILGGMGAKSGRQRFHKNISMNTEEMQSLKNLMAQGTDVFIQIVPDERAINLSKLI